SGAHPRLLLQVGRGLARLPGRLRLRVLVVRAGRLGRRQPPLRVLGEDRLMRGQVGLVALAGLALAVSGCSGSDSSGSKTETTPVLRATPTTPSPTPKPTPPPPPPSEHACYRIGYDTAVAPTKAARPVPCRDPHTAVTFYVGSFNKRLRVDGNQV